MFYDQDGDVCEPCLSCPEIYVEDIWCSLMCKAKKCPYERMREVCMNWREKLKDREKKIIYILRMGAINEYAYEGYHDLAYFENKEEAQSIADKLNREEMADDCPTLKYWIAKTELILENGGRNENDKM